MSVARFMAPVGTVTALIYAACLGAQGAPALDSVPRGNPTADATVQRIYDEGMHRSQAASLAQVLMDSIGPRLTGSPANRAANDWLVRTYTAWGVPAHNEQYGTWRDWTRGPSQVDLIAPRARLLEATMLEWSPGTPPGGVSGDVVILPPATVVSDSAAFAQWLTTAKGKFVMVSVPRLTCRPDSSWARWAAPASVHAMRAARDSAAVEWDRRVRIAGSHGGDVSAWISSAGALGILTNNWSEGWGVDKIMGGRGVWSNPTVPIFDVSCEDYSLLARLLAHGQHPRVHATAEPRLAPRESPVFNTIARIDGSEHPDQYVMLSAHLDSWDAGSGATANGTGTITALEAMRLVKLAYPHPKRTILVGHWSGEEQGELGSTSFGQSRPLHPANRVQRRTGDALFQLRVAGTQPAGGRDAGRIGLPASRRLPL